TTLQNKARAKCSQVGNTGYVKKDILRQHRRQARKNFFRLPTLPLEIDDIRLHKNRAAVAKNRHGLRRKRQIGKLIYIQAKSFGGGLQEISIARRTLCVELEVFHAAVVQDDDFDVLPAYVDDHVRIFVKLERRLGMRNGFHERDISFQHVLQNVLC